MALHRRDFLRGVTAASVAAAVAPALASVRDTEAAASVVSASAVPLLRPAGVRRGSRIGIAAPASSAMTRDLDGFLGVCRAQGLEPVLGRNIDRRTGYLSAPDQDRADELMAFIDDPTIDAIVCARGGYGVMRILPLLDFGAIRDAKKVIMGYSDITSLLIAVQQLSGIVSYHGPVASSTFDDFTVSYFTQSVVAQEPADIAPSNQSPILWSYTNGELVTIRPGSGRGRLTGGNLAMVVASLGTPYEIDTTGAILFLEDVNEEPYRVDRMLTQLALAGKLQACAGIALGSFTNCESKGVSIPGPSHSLQQVFKERMQSLEVPVVFGLPFGHVKSKLTLPLGATAELNATDRVLTVLTT